MPLNEREKIVIVGGGTGGLELACALGRRRAHRADVQLVDGHLTHIWKPLLHEIAAGTLDSGRDALDYLALARSNRFRFHYGRMNGLDRDRREILIDPIRDEQGRELVPQRHLPYDRLVLAVGGISNDFDTPGVTEHCHDLDSTTEAERFQQHMVRALLRAQAQEPPLESGQLAVVIVGAGATGVELAAELRNAARKAVHYGFDRIDPERDLTLTVIEAAERVLPALSQRLSEKTHRQLERLGVKVITGRRVTEVTDTGVRLDDGAFIPAEFRVWAAGVKAPDWLAGLDGLETARDNRLVVDDHLRTTRDARVHAIGDCAHCIPTGQSHPLGPRAQVATQQAAYLTRVFSGRTNTSFVFRDRGSLISLTENQAVGRLMSSVFGNHMIEGFMARTAYNLLNRRHQRALHGTPRVIALTLLDAIRKRTHPRLKLH